MEEPSLFKITFGSPELQVTIRLLFMERESCKWESVRQTSRECETRSGTIQVNRTETATHRARKLMCRELCARRWHAGAYTIYTTKRKTTLRAREAKPNSSTKRGAHLQPRPQDVFYRRLKPESQETRESVHSTLPLQRKWHVWKRLARLDVPSTDEGRHENYQKLRRLSAARWHCR